jgi:hypothetical protein
MNKFFLIFLLGITSFTACIGLTSNTPTQKKKSINIRIVYDSVKLVTEKSRIVYKKNTVLTWRDFYAPVDPNSQAAANSSVGLKYNAEVVSSDEVLNVNVSIAAYFDKKKSWYKKEVVDDHILKHEQIHFDIARVGVYFVKQAMLEINYSEDAIMDSLDKAYEKGWKKYLELQNEYDKSTNYSINKVEQEKWSAKIDSLLNVAYAK